MRSRNAFTLIELLVVIAIIAVLAAILFPVFANAKERARQNKCLNNLKQLSAAFQQYCADYNDVLPNLSSTMMTHPPDWCGSAACRERPELEKGQLWGYTRNREIYLCPTDYRVPVGIPGVNKLIHDFQLSYSVNGALLWAPYDVDDPPPPDQRPRLKFDSAVGRRASKILLLIHEDRERINDGYYGWDSGHDLPSDVHYDGTTVSYCDGHACWHNYDELTRQQESGIWDPYYKPKEGTPDVRKAKRIEQ